MAWLFRETIKCRPLQRYLSQTGMPPHACVVDRPSELCQRMIHVDDLIEPRCESAWGLDADRRGKPLIALQPTGSLCRAE
jgi:hypothetical protein